MFLSLFRIPVLGLSFSLLPFIAVKNLLERTNHMTERSHTYYLIPRMYYLIVSLIGVSMIAGARMLDNKASDHPVISFMAYHNMPS